MSTSAIIGGVVVLLVLIGGGFLLMNRTPVDEELQNEAMSEYTEGTLDQDAITPVDTMPGSSDGTQVDTGTASDAAVKEFTVEGNAQFRFNPTEIRVNQGDTVRVTFKNAGGVHDWKLDQFNVATEVLQAGQEETVEFVASQAGTFEYYCSVGNHRAMGMVGNLIVQ